MGVLFVIYLGAVFLISFIIVGSFTIYEKRQDIKAKKQHLMFNQLKKGDFIWKVSGDWMHRMEVSGVEYHFDGHDIVDKIIIGLSGEYHQLHMRPDDAKAFVFKELGYTYYTILEEAKLMADLTEVKRKKAIENAQSVDASDVTEKLNKEIKSLEKLRDETIDKLTIKLDEK
jgi:hypothetical protein